MIFEIFSMNEYLITCGNYDKRSFENIKKLLKKAYIKCYC
jgi:hypothetical protein